MLEKQTREAIAATLNNAGRPGGAVPAGGAMPGRRILAAMLAARESGCKCGACILMREELDTSIGSFLKVALEATEESATEPAAAAPGSSMTEASDGSGNDPTS